MCYRASGNSCITIKVLRLLEIFSQNQLQFLLKVGKNSATFFLPTLIARTGERDKKVVDTFNSA
jgi:hypothetical protein